MASQRWDSALALYDYRARYYHPALGRFISADPLVPEPGNPQALNRYAYVYNNPLRYTDSTGYYSEEEIMQSFGVKSWDEVLALFRQGGILEGRWGWLEILRRARDGYMVWSRSGSNADVSDRPSLQAWTGGFFSRNERGEILVNDRPNAEFALRFDEYWLQRSGMPPADPMSFSDAFYTRSDRIHYHPHLVWGIPNRDDALIDCYGIAFDVIGTLALANVEAGPVAVGIAGLAYGMGIAIDVGQFSEGVLHFYGYRYTGYFNSGHVLDVISIVPDVGAATDVISLISNLTGLRVDVTP